MRKNLKSIIDIIQPNSMLFLMTQSYGILGLRDLLKNAEPMKSIGIDSQYTVPVIHYEILFSLYSNTRLATADERKQKFLENQIVNLVEDCSADEIAPTYARLVSELQRGDYKLLDTWKKQQYQKAISILQE